MRRKFFVELQPCDVGFKIALCWAAVDLLGLTGAARTTAMHAFLLPGILTTVAWWLVMLPLLAPLDRWLARGGSDDDLRAAERAARRAPYAAAIGNAICYPTYLVLPVIQLSSGGGVEIPLFSVQAVAIMGLGVALGCGAFSVVHGLWSLDETLGRIALAARERGLPLRPARGSMRLRTALFVLGIALAPATILTGMTYLTSVQAELAGDGARARLAATRLAHGVAPAGGDVALSFRLPDDGGAAAIGDAYDTVPGALVARARAELDRGAQHAFAHDARSGRTLALVREATGTYGVIVRATHEAAPRTARRALVLLVTIIAFAITAALYLSGHILAGVRRVARAVRDIAHAGGVAGTARIPVLARDELGTLTEGVNHMIDGLDEAQAASARAAESLRVANAQLEARVAERTVALREANRELTENVASLRQARSQLADAARQAGMAEVASSVIHNVGNVLNSVNVSAGIIAGGLRGSALGTLAKGVAMLPQNAGEAAAFFTADRRGELLPTFLRRSCAELEAQHQTALAELEFLARNIDHIKVVISLQQDHARPGGLVESFALADLIDDALRFSLVERDGAPNVERQLAALAPITADRHRVFQILVNLARNARDAVQTAPGEKRIVVRTRLVDPLNVLVEFVDSGCGIAPENLTKIFGFGFTTKRNGHGYGLHSSAIAARELGGELTAESDGVGRGATFVLRLPVVPRTASFQVTASMLALPPS